MGFDSVTDRVSWPLVGRAEELRRIRSQIVGTASRGILLAGAAGVGKTCLAREAAASLKKTGFAPAWVSATSAAASIPLGALHRGLRQDERTRIVLVSPWHGFV